MKPLRTLDRATRRARLIAARPYPIGGIVRRGILGGQFDGGRIVREAGEAQRRLPKSNPDYDAWRTTVEAEAAARREPDCVGGVYMTMEDR